MITPLFFIRHLITILVIITHSNLINETIRLLLSKEGLLVELEHKGTADTFVISLVVVVVVVVEAVVCST